MNPADLEMVKNAVKEQGAMLGTHQQGIVQVNSNLETVAEQLNSLSAQVQQLLSNASQPQPTPPQASPAPPSPATPSPFREPRLPAPQPYDGNPNNCRSFLSQCSLTLELQSLAFPTERSRVAYLITLLTGRAREWGTAVWDANATCCSSYKTFTDEMKKVFDRSHAGREAAREIMALRQGTRSVFDYAIEFRTLSASCKWNDDALYDAFLNGLSDAVKDELVPRELPSELTELMDLAGRIDARIRQRNREKTPAYLRPGVKAPPPELPPPEPMQIDRARVTPEERQRRRDTGACFYCGKPSLAPDEFPDLSNVPEEYLDLKPVFSKSQAVSLPPHRPYDCAIELLPGSFPPKGSLYSLSPPERDAMKKYISDSLAAGIIRPSSSPAGAGFFFVGKKDGSLRPCIDYRGLNDITVKNRYPLPLMSTAFELIQGASVFSKLDLRNAYHLVRIREGDEWKTAFNTPTGHYEYLVVPFGLTNAPAVFQALVNDVLRDFLNVFVFVYLDDILIFSPSLEAHRHHVRQVLQRLLENKLFVKAEKCEFHRDTVSFLGFVLSPSRIQMDPLKLKAVKDWPTPTTRRALQQFLGFANFYRRFIRGYSSVAGPLTALTSTKTSFHWGREAEKAFADLKNNSPQLRNPTPCRPSFLQDAWWVQPCWRLRSSSRKP
ncbi:uncharacterized protein LOC134437997 [Engraulis encrasicolus]|uniref:uncharacterized protein LOC134437997 n=1 Tax=Engraulis encrasicolus TaxID=184585 RepID=UPI002FD1980E